MKPSPSLSKLAKKALLHEKEWGINEVLVTPKKQNKPKAEAVTTPKAKIKEPVAEYIAVADASKPLSVKAKAIIKLHKTIEDCQKCSLGKSRIKIVPGSGNADAKIMFIGEAPGYDEDRQGLPFVGRAGQLLTKIIEAMGLKREDVFIANIVKCHPMTDPSDPELRGNDRPPKPDEVDACFSYLENQIDIIKPEFIVLLGNSAMKAVLKTEETISKMRGTVSDYRGAKLMPTYHPAALLRNPSLKKDVWEDMKKIMAHVNRSK